MSASPCLPHYDVPFILLFTRLSPIRCILPVDNRHTVMPIIRFDACRLRSESMKDEDYLDRSLLCLYVGSIPIGHLQRFLCPYSLA